VEAFVYGREGLDRSAPKTRFPGRQTREASEAVARLHGVNHSVFLEQNPSAIDAGAFHNDVVCVVNERVVFYHELAFADVSEFQETMKRAGDPLGFTPVFVMAKDKDFPLTDAIKSYVFNSQLLTRHDNSMTLIVPSEAQTMATARAFIDAAIADDNPITEVIYRDVRESMKNGGGPACLRLRVVMSAAQMAAAHQGVMMSETKLDHLAAWVKRTYREYLDPDDLGDPNLIDEVRTALDQLTQILGLGALYDFQKD
jgi:succinylarginine dihydrolase